jgi:hypothetical protein
MIVSFINPTKVRISVRIASGGKIETKYFEEVLAWMISVPLVMYAQTESEDKG